VVHGIFNFEFDLGLQPDQSLVCLAFERFPLCKPLIERLYELAPGACTMVVPDTISLDIDDTQKNIYYFGAPDGETATDFSGRQWRKAQEDFERTGHQFMQTQVDHLVFLMNSAQFFGPIEADYIRRYFGRPIVWGIDAGCSLQTWYHNHMHLIIDNNKLDLFGPLEPEEGAMLNTKVSELKHLEGDIVEIGTFSGKSAIAMALALKGSPSKIFTVDRQFHEMFWPNVKRFKVENQIVAIENASPEALKDWIHHPDNSSRKINLLFIDGGHTYEEVVSDFNAWEPYLIKAGYLCFHDYDAMWGVQRAVYDTVIKSERFDSFERVNHLLICRKIRN
jgi:predicted O-methyltransferase YrrM